MAIKILQIPSCILTGLNAGKEQNTEIQTGTQVTSVQMCTFLLLEEKLG